MKKAISLLVALAATFSIVMTGFAADNSIEDMGEPGIAAHLEYAQGSTDQNPLVRADVNDLVLSLGTSNQLVLPETHLTPGTEYEYKIFRVTAATGAGVHPDNLEITPVTDGDLNGGRIRLRTGKGSSAISNISINKRGAGVNATYNLVVETRANYGINMTDVEYSLVVSGQGNDTLHVMNNSIISFRVGYEEMSDDEIDSYGEGDIVTVYHDTPVFTKRQLERLARNFNYKAVEFQDENGDWGYTGRISGMGASNFITTHDVIPAIVNALPDQDFHFLTFLSGVTFPTNGEMRIDVADISDEYGGRIYAYIYRNNTLTPIATTYDSATDEIVFRTNYLGAFVLTDREITDTDILNPNEPEINEPEDNDNNLPGNNPDTGAATGANVAATLALASLAAAAVIRKRK